jgi:hypothetical protein
MSEFTKNLKFFIFLFAMGFIFISCVSFLGDNGINIINSIGLSIFLIIGIVTAILIYTTDANDDNYSLDSECLELFEDETTKED